MSDTPRTDAAWALCIELDARFPMHDLSTQLERELNAANERIKRLEHDLYEIKVRERCAGWSAGFRE